MNPCPRARDNNFLDPPVDHLTSFQTKRHSNPVLLVLEGAYDIEFFRRLSRALHASDRSIVDLGTWEQQGRLIFVPTGGGDQLAWTARLAPLGCPEVHIYDRDGEPATARRYELAAHINRRPSCRAFVTGKRTLENYLHPAAIRDALSIDLPIGDDEDVAVSVAEHLWKLAGKPLALSALPLRARKRCRDRAKRRLNTLAVARMTRVRLHERDPAGEFLHWLATVRQLAGST